MGPVAWTTTTLSGGEGVQSTDGRADHAVTQPPPPEHRPVSPSAPRRPGPVSECIYAIKARRRRLPRGLCSAATPNDDGRGGGGAGGVAAAALGYARAAPLESDASGPAKVLRNHVAANL